MGTFYLVFNEFAAQFHANVNVNREKQYIPTSFQ